MLTPRRPFSWRARLALLLAPLAAAALAGAQERRIPKDSVELAVQGCLKGRVLAVVEPDERHGPVRGPDVTGRSFRLSGKKPVIDEVKKHDGDLVEVVGLVRTADLASYQPGMRVGRTRVVIGAPGTMDPNRPPPPGPGLPVMDASSVRFLWEGCPIK
jgi:hypothetical protein